MQSRARQPIDPFDERGRRAREALARTRAGQPSPLASPRDRRADQIPPSVSPEQSAGQVPDLTARELQVLEGMSHGRSNAEIGREIGISEDTVKTHARRLFKKLGANDRAHAVALGFRLDFLR